MELPHHNGQTLPCKVVDDPEHTERPLAFRVRPPRVMSTRGLAAAAGAQGCTAHNLNKLAAYRAAAQA